MRALHNVCALPPSGDAPALPLIFFVRSLTRRGDEFSYNDYTIRKKIYIQATTKLPDVEEEARV
jgi:hypothetical protein